MKMPTQILKQQATDASLRRFHGTPLLGLLLVIGLLVSTYSQSQAADITWTNGTASYNNAANWSPNQVPGSGDNAINNNGTDNAVQINAEDPAWTVVDPQTGTVEGTGGAFELNGSTLNVNGWFRLGMATNSSGLLTLNGGTLNVLGGRLMFGEGADTSGQMTINDGVINKTGDVFVFGDAGWGGDHPTTQSVVQNGGTINSSSEIWIGQGNGATTTYDFHGGTINQSNWFVVARGGSIGTMNMDGGTINKRGGGNFIVGDNSLGILNFSAGTIDCTGEFWIGQAGNGRGTNNMSGTAVLNVLGNWMAVGRDNGTGELNLSDNAIVNHTGNGNSQVLTIAGVNAPTGIINQNGGVVTNTTSDTWLGENGTGIWNMDAGAAYLGYLQIGRAGSAIGTMNLNGGILSATEITSGDGYGTLNLNGGTLRARGDSVNFLHNVDVVDIQAGGAIFDTDGYDVTVSQDLNDGLASNGALTKNSAGTLILSGANNYQGPTMVNGGKLISGTSGYTAGAVTVADGAGFGVELSFSGGQVYPAALTLGSSGATTLDFDLGAFGNPFSAPIAVGGNLVVNGTVTVNVATDLPQVGQFPLISFFSKSGSGSFTLGPLPNGVVASLVETASSIELNITQVDAVRWDGSVNGDWDIGTTINWVNTGTSQPSTYADGNPASFDDDAQGTTAVNITTTVNPNGVTFDNSTLDYSFSGSGKISGPIEVIKRGTGTATIGNTGGNDYTGATRVQEGTLSVSSLANGGSPSAIGASSSDPSNLVLAGGTLHYTGPATTIDRGYSVTETNSAIQTDGDLSLSGSVQASAGSVFLKTGTGTLSYIKGGTNEIGRGGAPGFAAYNAVNGTLVLDGTAAPQTNYIVGQLWVGGTVDSGASMVMSNSMLVMSDWLALGRGNGSDDYLSTIRLEDSKINLTGGGFSAGYDANLPLDFGIMVLARQDITLNGNSAINVANGSIFLAERRGATTTVKLNDTSSLTNRNNAGIGLGGGGSVTGSTGTMEIADSAVWQVGAWLSIGNEGGTGSILVKDSGSLIVLGDLNVTDVGASTGTLIAQDNAYVEGNVIFVGKDDNAAGVFTITNDATAVARSSVIMGRYWDGHAVTPTTAEINLAGGSLAAGNVQGTITNDVPQGTFNFNGGRLIARAQSANLFMFDLAAINVMSGGAVIDSDTNTITIAQPLLDAGGGGGLTKLGSGTLNLNGTNTYTGATLVNEGALGGSGVINSPVTVGVGGTLAPGTSVGTLTINGSLSLTGNTLIEVDTSLVQSNDVVNVSGALSYGGTLTVANIGATALEVGDTFTVFPSGGTGSFSSVDGGDAVFDFNDGVLTVISVGSPELLWSNLGGGVIEFSWNPGSKLVYQTNSLGIGLSTNWMDYPDASNPVQVTIDPAIPSTFFSLQPE